MRAGVGLRRWLALAMLAGAAGFLGALPPGASLDLRSWDWEVQGVQGLEGTWEFYWQALFEPLDFEGPLAPGRPVLGSPEARAWIDPHQGEKFPARGYGTYRLGLVLPSGIPDLALRTGLIGGSARIWWNGEEVGRFGTPGKSLATTTHHWHSRVIPLPLPAPGADGVRRGELVIQAANWVDVTTSFQSFTPRLGTLEAVEAEEARTVAIHFLLAGLSLAVGLFHFLNYLFRRGLLSNVFFSVVCLGVAVRILFSDTMPIINVFPQLGYHTSMVVNYLTYTVLTASLSGFVATLFPYPRISLILGISGGVGALAYSVAILTQPLETFVGAVLYYQIFTMVLAILLVMIFILALMDRRPGAGIFGLGFLIIVGTILWDILTIALQKEGISMGSYGVMTFMALQALFLARSNAQALHKAEHLSEYLKKANTAQARFLPRELVKRIGKDLVTDIKPGDYFEGPACVLALDYGISFQGSINADTLTLAINEIHGAIGPYIRAGDGYVLRYHAMGASILFPGKDASAALECSLALVRAGILGRLRNGAVLNLRAGIHYGTVLVGLLGEPEHINGAVISAHLEDAQSLARRGGKLGVRISMSQSALKALPTPEKFHFRRIGVLALSDGAQATYDFFDSDDLDAWRAKRSTQQILDRSLNHLALGRTMDAVEGLRKVLEKYPGDYVAQFHLERLGADLVD